MDSYYLKWSEDKKTEIPLISLPSLSAAAAIQFVMVYGCNISITTSVTDLKVTFDSVFNLIHT